MSTSSTASNDPTPPDATPAARDVIGSDGDHDGPARVPGLDGDPLTIDELEHLVVDRFGDAVQTLVQHGELTVHLPDGDLLREVLTWARDDEAVTTRVLADLSGVHWPAGEHVIERQPSTTGWPEHRTSREVGVVEVLYVLRSWQRNHQFRVAVSTPDTDAVLPSVVDLFATANFHEREVYDMFGVHFEGHPDLRRILMPDDWVGHPHRKDYPLGGVDIPYEHDKHIPPPDERDLREVVR